MNATQPAEVTYRLAAVCPQCSRHTRVLIGGVCSVCHKDDPEAGPPKPRHSEKRRRWTAAEETLLQSHYRPQGAMAVYARLAPILGRTPEAIRERATHLGIARKGGHRTVWTPERDEQLATLYGRHTPTGVARRMGLSVAAVCNRAHVLGVRSSDHDGWYSATEAAALFGVEQHWVLSRIRSGAIKATRRSPTRWRIEATDLRAFVVRYPSELQGRTVQMVPFVALLEAG